MTESVVAAIDQGTTSTRCLLFNRAGRMLAVAQREHRQYYPAPGLVEHDAMEIWRNVSASCRPRCAAPGSPPTSLVALGIANQRETTVIWNRHTGQPLARAITWQDTRTDEHGRRLVADGRAELVTEICGLPPATYFAGPRLRWLLDHVPGARAGAEAGDVLFGTMESWLIWRLTGGADGVHVTDVTNASRTMLMDLRTLRVVADAAEDPRRAGADAARDPPQRRGVRRVHARCCPGCRWPARSATSRRRWSGRPASRPARSSAPTAPARSC